VPDSQQGVRGADGEKEETVSAGTHPLATPGNRIDYLAGLADAVGTVLNQGEKWAYDVKRQLVNAIHDQSKEGDLAKRLAAVEARLDEEDRDKDAAKDVVPPSLKEVECQRAG
jgi:hypothetical protein